MNNELSASLQAHLLQTCCCCVFESPAPSSQHQNGFRALSHELLKNTEIMLLLEFANSIPAKSGGEKRIVKGWGCSLGGECLCGFIAAGF